jgi:predicted signal transduction protein with EAL and GGDEF domain
MDQLPPVALGLNDREIFLTASIGLALSDPQTQLSEEIIKDAELAMYHSKRIGGDRIDVYKPQCARARSRKARKPTRTRWSLYQLGCEYAQGFACAEPMDADAAMRLLTEERLEAAS